MWQKHRTATLFMKFPTFKNTRWTSWPNLSYTHYKQFMLTEIMSWQNKVWFAQCTCSYLQREISLTQMHNNMQLRLTILLLRWYLTNKLVCHNPKELLLLVLQPKTQHMSLISKLAEHHAPSSLFLSKLKLQDWFIVRLHPSKQDTGLWSEILSFF